MHNSVFSFENASSMNAMCGVVLGRKNYLFTGADSGGDGAAVMYTIVRTAKLDGVNPEAHLRDTFTKIADGTRSTALERCHG